MKEKDMKRNENKQESDLITKESFCATCMIFSLLALLILCTGEWIFGGFGQSICAFLTGLVGYCAYPLMLVALYVSVMGLLGKKYLKNRKAALGIALMGLFLALIVHTVQTTMLFAWKTDSDYLNACLQAGEGFPSVTVAGWIGGVFVFFLSSILSNVGALILFSILFLFSVYLTIILLRKGEEEVATAQFTAPMMHSAQPAPFENVQQPMQEAQMGQPNLAPMNTQGAPMQQPQNTQMPFYAQTTQRPGVSIPDEPVRSNGGFSPFGKVENIQESAQKDKHLEASYQNSREFLFGSSPAEYYSRNLIYQPSSNVNNLPPAEATPPVVNSGYAPSYTNAYESSIENETQEAPMKIVQDHTYQNQSYEQMPTPFEEQTLRPEYSPFTAPTVNPIQPQEPFREEPKEYLGNGYEKESWLDTTPFAQETRDAYPAHEDTAFESPSFESPYQPMQREEEPKEDPYKRHDYMSLFSAENPNVFGRVEEGRGDNPFAAFEDRTFEDRNRIEDNREADGNYPAWSNPHEDIQKEEKREEPTRDGLYLFDELPEENPYALRSDYLEQPNAEQEEVEPARDRSYDGEPTREDCSFTDRGREMEEGYFQTPYDREENVEAERREDTPFGFSDRGSNRAEAARVEPYEEVSREVEYMPLHEERGFVEPPHEEVKPIPKKPQPRKPYKRISLDDLDCREVEPQLNKEEVDSAKDTILATLEDFKVQGASIASVTYGPTVTRYNVTIPRYISPKKVVALDQSIAISLYSEGVNIYPNFEDGVVSIEVPNKERQFVQLGSMLSGDSYVNAKSSSLMFAMGKDVANRKIYGDISKMIHMLVAGASGSGKSVFLGALIISLIHKYSPEELRLILIDPKKTEFVLYNDLPHLMINEIITDVNKAVQSLNWAIEEMNRRYGLFEQMSRSGTYVVNLDQYNAHIPKEERLPKIVVIIDELADLMLAAKKEIEEKIQNLTQKARAAGIHLIVATQRPSTDVITGVIKSNLPTRIAFGVATDVDSRVILDQTGAQKLLGKGDFLYVMQGLKTPARVQSAFISPEESQKVVNFIKANNEAYYDEEVTAYINNARGGSSGEGGSRFDRENVEPVYIEALRYVIQNGSASISMIQRKCSAGYNKAGKIIEWMEEMEYISPFDGAKARKVLITKEEFEKKYGSL